MFSNLSIREISIMTLPEHLMFQNSRVKVLIKNSYALSYDSKAKKLVKTPLYTILGHRDKGLSKALCLLL